jgi:hypothetical protein
MKKNILYLGLAATLLLQSCATIMSGKTQTMTFVSEPSGAQVSVDGNVIGTTPITTDISRKTENIVFQKEGLDPYSLKVKQSSNPWAYGNLAFLPIFFVTPIIGIAIDNGTGASLQVKKLYEPDGTLRVLEEPIIKATLQKKDSSAAN